MVASLSTRPSARSGPQCPWSVYSHRQVSAISTRSRSASRSRRRVSWTIPSSIQPPVPMASLSAGQAEQDHAADAEGLRARGRPRSASSGVTRIDAGHRAHGLAALAAGLHEHRGDQLAGVDPGLAHERAQRLGPAGAAQAVGRVDGRDGAVRGRPAAGRSAARLIGLLRGDGGVGVDDGVVGAAGGDGRRAERTGGEVGEGRGVGRGRDEHRGEPGVGRGGGGLGPGGDDGGGEDRGARASSPASASRPRTVEPLVRTRASSGPSSSAAASSAREASGASTVA